MKLLITTQVYENYGAHDWDGKGECPQYWKAKGGSDYVIKKFKGGAADATLAVMAVRSQIEEDNDHFRESVIDFRLVKDDYLTEFEQSQLDYEGSIRYPAKELAW
jgi:3-methyladenine DNA glycosylase AlkC